MKPEGPTCQSCGMPLSRDQAGGGTNADGSRSQEYCSHCYREGRFTDPQMTVAQMADRVRGKLASLNLPGPAVDRLVSAIPTLRRWKETRA